MGLNINNTTPDELNRYFLRTSLWPAVLYTTILMLVGAVGNTLVIVVYKRQFRRSVTRMFIYTLAILDLGNCLITMPAELMILIQFTNFPSPMWCKLSRYLTYTFNGTSSIILITIALDRYFKVCRPTQMCINVKRARLICIGAFLFTAVCSIPALILYGDMFLPIVVSHDEATILPMINSSYGSAGLDTDKGIMAMPKPTDSTQGRSPYSYPAEGVQLIGDGSAAFAVYGKFCLLNSDHIDSLLPLLFYVSMFILYLIMVVLVIFFYSKVARAMFILTSKHSKMFTFYAANNSTPASNSVVAPGEPGVVVFHRPGSNIVTDDPNVGYATDVGRGTGDATDNHDQLRKEELVKENEMKLKDSRTQNNPSVPRSQPQVSETGYNTDDASSNCNAKLSEDGLREGSGSHSDGKLNETRATNGLISGSCSAIAQVENGTAEAQPKLSSPTKSTSLGDLLSSSRSGFLHRSRSSSQRQSKKKGSQKIPKIKVQDVSSKEKDSSQMANYPVPGEIDLSLYPLSSNSLLLRRIKSAENINSLSRLYKLQVPERQSKHKPHLLDRCEEVFIARTRKGKPRHRETVTGIGNVSKSCINLDVISGGGDDVDSSKTREKTWTLTKTSPKGKKKLCTIPLTGLSTKTAIHAREIQQPVVNGSDKSLSSANRSLLGINQDEKHAPTVASTPQNLSSSDLDSEVMMRPRTPDSTSLFRSRGNTLSGEDKKSDSGVKSVRTPRQEIVSTADILQEHHQRGSLHPVRTSRMLFIISLVFVISFLPFFVIVLVRSSEGSAFLTSLSDVELALVSVFIRSSLISNAVNPIVYGLLSTHFRRECTGVMCCLFRD